MRTTERLRRLKEWAEKELCEGRQMKAIPADQDVTKIVRQQPRCYLAWQPTRPDEFGNYVVDPVSVCPSIVIMPSASHAKNVEEKRFDRYAGVHRPAELAQTLAVSILFSVYEPGVRMPGFSESADESGEGLDISLLKEGTEEGLMTLIDWMDDCMEKLLGQRFIPHTDLFIKESSIVYSLYTDQNYVVDRRPVYYGFVNCEFQCYADEGTNSSIEGLLN